MLKMFHLTSENTPIIQRFWLTGCTGHINKFKNCMLSPSYPYTPEFWNIKELCPHFA
jgi:hypothetical protein